VGSESLLARELRELISERKGTHIELLAGREDSNAVLTEEEGEAIALAPLTDESLQGVSIALLAGSPPSSRKALRIAQTSRTILVDATGALEDQPAARLRAPQVEDEPTPLSAEHIHVIAHPAAIALALLFSRLDPLGGIKRSVVHVYEPASERGQAGIDELQKQTVALLNFQQLPKNIYDTQLGFTMLARYGAEAYEPLEDIEQRIDRHLATLLGPWPRLPMPSLRLIQAPVFHGYSFSVWAEFEQSLTAEDIEQRLASALVEVRTGEEEAPTNIGAAGQSGISVGVIEADRNQRNAFWFWVAADNLKLAADNAVLLVGDQLGGTR
jgi:aspartate-semialdehyde dehydrogenase